MNLFEKIYKKSFLFEDDDEVSLDEPSDSGGGDDGGFDFDSFDADSDAGGDAGGDSGGLDSGGDFGADSLGGGGGGSDGVDVPEEGEESEQEEAEETPPPKDSLETDQEVSAIQSSVDDVIDDALMASSMAASAVMGESTILSKIFEDEEEKSNGKNLGVDIEKFASKIANLMQNYTTVLDIPNLIYQSARKRLESDYGQEWVSKFEDIIANMQLSVPIGYGSTGPVAFKSVGNDVNPQNIATGNVFVTSTGGKDG